MAKATGIVRTSRKNTASVREMGSYETYITGLIYFRNGLEALIESWPKGDDEMPLSIASCAPGQNDRFLLRLSELIDGYERGIASHFKIPATPFGSSDITAEARPAGLPRIADGSRLEKDLLTQIIQLMADLLRLKMYIRGPLR